MENKTIKGYKVFNSDFTCRGVKFEVGQTYELNGYPVICEYGYHFCLKASDCFSYYSFNPANIVCEVEALGSVVGHTDDSKQATNKIKILRQLEWAEVLIIANSGSNNTGRSNSGNSNSGNWNSGNNNSGYWNSGNWNSGDNNSGYRNSGNWNSGYRNSGDNNSGYRNSGAFCLNNDPTLYLFDKPTSITVRQWEQSKPIQIMNEYLIQCIWVQGYIMTEEEKITNPKWETTDGYLKTISLKEAWSNMWNNLSEENKQVFLTLENFNAESFESITGIKTN